MKLEEKNYAKNLRKKCVKSENERAKSMFPIKEQFHNMNTRKEEFFVVNHANTERLKNSSIPYMQRMLNNDKKLELENQKLKMEINKENPNRRRRKPG